MSVRSGQAKLNRAAKDLLARWDAIKAIWYDENSRKFEENHLEPLRAKLRSAEVALAHMDAVLNQIRHDCE